MKINLSNLTCGYRNKIILENFTTTISSGEILCLLGPNGVGKTTLFKTILGFLSPISGTITIENRNIKEFSKVQLAKRLGYVPQSHIPPFPFSVVDVVVMGRTAHLGPFSPPGKKDLEKAYAALENLKISHLRNRTYTELSGGEQQMVLIARALVQEPAFIILDEPTSNLDYGNQVRVLQQVIQLAKQKIGIIMTTHFPDHGFLCDDRVVLIENKTQFTIGSSREVLTEKALSRAYGVQVKITSLNLDGQTIQTCTPII